MSPRANPTSKISSLRQPRSSVQGRYSGSRLDQCTFTLYGGNWSLHCEAQQTVTKADTHFRGGYKNQKKAI
ncbi:hypothetical protein O3P69_017215 [Scylla paramamosain]|uniref:Uncharacterized protein n=1 Tax=Scylla paramamosain TaxID=85552 RepID=A0AAW0TXZ1_SCYPA